MHKLLPASIGYTLRAPGKRKQQPLGSYIPQIDTEVLNIAPPVNVRLFKEVDTDLLSFSTEFDLRLLYFHEALHRDVEKHSTLNLVGHYFQFLRFLMFSQAAALSTKVDRGNSDPLREAEITDVLERLVARAALYLHCQTAIIRTVAPIQEAFAEVVVAQKADHLRYIKKPQWFDPGASLSPDQIEPYLKWEFKRIYEANFTGRHAENWEGHLLAFISLALRPPISGFFTGSNRDTDPRHRICELLRLGSPGETVTSQQIEHRARTMGLQDMSEACKEFRDRCAEEVGRLEAARGSFPEANICGNSAAAVFEKYQNYLWMINHTSTATHEWTIIHPGTLITVQRAGGIHNSVARKATTMLFGSLHPVILRKGLTLPPQSTIGFGDLASEFFQLDRASQQLIFSVKNHRCAIRCLCEDSIDRFVGSSPVRPHYHYLYVVAEKLFRLVNPERVTALYDDALKNAGTHAGNSNQVDPPDSP